MSLTVLGSFSLGGINLAADASLAVMAPLLGQFDLMVSSPFGLGNLQGDISAQFNAAVQANIQIGIQIINPFTAIQSVLAAIGNIEAALTASLSLPIPTPQITAQLAASASIMAVLGAKLSGIQGLISTALSLKNPAVDFLVNLTAQLGVGPIVAASWGFATSPGSLAQAGIDISNAFSAGLPGIAPGDTVYGVLLVTSSVSASAAISATMKVT